MNFAIDFKNVFITPNGIIFKLFIDNYYVDEKDEEEDEEENEYSIKEGYRFISTESIQDVPIRQIYDFFSKRKSKYLDDFLRLSIPKENTEYKNISESSLHILDLDVFSIIHKERKFSVIMDLSLNQIIDYLASVNNKANNNVINLKDSDTEYDQSIDDLVHPRTFFYVNKGESIDYELLDFAKNILSIFSSSRGFIDINRNWIRPKNSFLNNNFFDERTQMSNLIEHHISKEDFEKNEVKPSYGAHTKNSENLIYNLILNGDDNSFYKAYHLLMDNHSFKEYESDRVKSINFANRKIEVPHKIEDRRSARSIKYEDDFYDKPFVYEEHLISLKNAFYKRLAETAPITYFLDMNYALSSLIPYTQAAVTTFMLSGSQNTLLDDSSKRAEFTFSTFMYIFSQLYVRGDLSGIQSLNSEKILERVRYIAKNKLTVADLKRILNMIVPYSNYEYSNRVRIAEKLNEKARDGDVHSQKKLREVMSSISELQPRFDEISSIIYDELQKRSNGNPIYQEIEEEDFYNGGVLENIFNTTEEKLLTIREQGSGISKDEVLRLIDQERNGNLANFCVKNDFISFEDLPEELLLNVSLPGLDKKRLFDFKNALLSKSIYKDYVYKYLSDVCKNLNVKTLSEVARIESDGFFLEYLEKDSAKGILSITFSSYFYSKEESFDASFFIKIFEEKFNNNIAKMTSQITKIGRDIGIDIINDEIFYTLIKKAKETKFSGLDKLDIYFLRDLLYDYSEEKRAFNPSTSLNLNEDRSFEIISKKEEVILAKFKSKSKISKSDLCIDYELFGKTLKINISESTLARYIKTKLGSSNQKEVFETMVEMGNAFFTEAVSMMDLKDFDHKIPIDFLSKNNSISYLDANKIFSKIIYEEGSFEDIVSKIVNGSISDDTKVNIDDNLNIDDIISSKVFFIKKLVSSTAKEDEIVYGIDRGLGINGSIKKISLFLARNIIKSNSFIMKNHVYVKKDNEIIIKLYENDLLKDSKAVFKEAFEELDYVLFRKNSSSMNTYKSYISKVDQLYLIRSQLTNSVKKIFDFINAKDYYDKIIEELTSILKNPPSGVAIDIYNDILNNIKIKGKILSEIKTSDLKNMYEYMFDSENIEILKIDYKKIYSSYSIEKLSNRINDSFLTKSLNKDISEKERFIYLIMSSGVFIDKAGNASFNSIRDLASSSSSSSNLKDDLKKLFKNKDEESLANANKSLFVDSLSAGDENIRYLFLEVLKKDITNISPEIYSLIESVKQNNMMDNFRSLCYAIYLLRDNLESIKLPLSASSINAFITKGLRRHGDVVSSSEIKNAISSLDCKEFFNFPYILDSIRIKSDNCRNLDPHLIEKLISFGYDVGSIDIEYARSDFFKNILTSLKEGNFKRGEFLDYISKKYNMNKEDIFHSVSEFFRNYDVIKAFSSSEKLTDDILLNCKDKNEIFYKFNIENITSEDNKFNMRTKIIPQKDAYALVVGLDTDCCQRLGGAATNICIESLVGENSAVIMFEYKTENPKVGHKDSKKYGYEIFGQAFTSIFNGNIILDNIEFNKYAKKEMLYPCLKELYKACKEINFKLLCGNSSHPFNSNDFSEINIKDERVIWSGSISHTYRDFKGRGSLIEFDIENEEDIKKDSYFFARIKKLADYLSLIDGKYYIETLNLLQLEG